VFETAQLGRKVSRAEFKEQEPVLRTELLEIQQQLRSASFPVILVFGGVDGAGKSETVNVLNEWMDPRGIITRAFEAPSEDERARPEFWRYWLALPPAGRIGIYLSSWYSRPLVDRAYDRIDIPAFDQRLDRIAAFEKELADDGALILKFWMHLGKKAQKKRLVDLEKDPLTRWRVTDTEKRHAKMYDAFATAAERLIQKTSTGQAPWEIVEGSDHNYRTLAVLARVRDAVRQRLAQAQEQRAAAPAKVQAKTKARRPAARRTNGAPTGPTVLSQLDMTQSVSRKDYKVLLEQYQGKMNLLARKAKAAKVSTILVFEGADAAGKGGAIRRVMAALDAREYQVIPIAAPTDEEKAHHYLWRFWRHLPPAGRITVFDRTWYGRVLVERVEGFASEDAWSRAYAEINDFEEQLIEHHTVILKYWIHITKNEQLARFKAREDTAYKRYKITPEDWRNREKWEAYEQAVHDMVARTSTVAAPWTLVEGNDKNFARIKIIRTLCDRLEEKVGKVKL
jgi:polyphosphate:AMP phosphotransferase